MGTVYVMDDGWLNGRTGLNTLIFKIINKSFGNTPIIFTIFCFGGMLFDNYPPIVFSIV